MKKQLLLQGLVLALGFWVTALGCSLFIGSNLGTEGFTLASQGVAMQLGLSVGLVNSLMSLVMIAVVFCIDKSYIKVGTLLALVVLGPGIDFWMWVCDLLYQWMAPFLLLRFACMGIAIVVLAIGISLVMSAKLGTHINDAMPVLLSKTIFKRWSFRVSKVLWDCTLVATGVLLGGVFGAGTVASACCLGPILQWCIPRIEMVVNKTVLKNAVF